MDDPKKQLADQLTSATNILVTISRNPSIDQVASCIGLTLILNKMGKHAAAVFSGNVPSTLEFLQPEETLEKNTDSLRDFIIAIDKTKADKLRYKVEDDVVRIFITPYKTSISDADLAFSQGDFNVDVVLALGVGNQQDLDQAITAHGRILHDATIATINTVPGGDLGVINWVDKTSSSLSELVTDLAEMMNPELLDEQIATALLTGIVSETDRFSNDKTSPITMSVSAQLMAAGANQQLVATKLEEGGDIPLMVKGSGSNSPKKEKHEDGELDIDHTPPPPPKSVTEDADPDKLPSTDFDPFDFLDDNGKLTIPKLDLPSESGPREASAPLNTLPPKPAPAPPAPSSFTPPPTTWTPPAPAPIQPAPAPAPMPTPAPITSPTPNPFNDNPLPPTANRTLTDLEQAVDSPHLAPVDDARDEVSKALAADPGQPSPIPEPSAEINAQQPPAGGMVPPPVPPPIPFQFGTPPEQPKQ